MGQLSGHLYPVNRRKIRPNGKGVSFQTIKCLQKGLLSGHLRRPDMQKSKQSERKSVVAIENGTAERALTYCRSSHNTAERTEVSFQNTEVRAKGTAERALTGCNQSQDSAGKKHISFQTRSVSKRDR